MSGRRIEKNGRPRKHPGPLTQEQLDELRRLRELTREATTDAERARLRRARLAIICAPWPVE